MFQMANANRAITTVKVVNSLASIDVDDCTPKINEHVRRALEFMQIEVWREACLHSAQLRDRPEMHGIAIARPTIPQQTLVEPPQ